MQRYISVVGLLCIALFFFSCKVSKDEKSKKKKTEEKIEVSFTVRIIEKYCKGHRMSQLLVDEYEAEKTAKFEKFYVVNKKDKHSYKLFLDENGYATIKICPGDYSVYFLDKVDGVVNAPTPKCLEWKEVVDAEFSARENGTNINFTVTKTCNPCSILKP